jgi:hypothetical protein
VLYLGETNDQKQEAADSVQVKLTSLELRRPRIFGHCW